MGSHFDTEEYARRETAAHEAGAAAASFSPDLNSFGFFAYGDAPGAIGGGFGVFHWFQSRNVLLAHLADHLTYESPGRHDTDPFAVHDAVKQAVDDFRNSDASFDSLIVKLNQLLRNYSQITWIGRLRDLTEGSGNYETQVREEFRNHIESTEGTAPIQSFETAEFLDFLSEYGI